MAELGQTLKRKQAGDPGLPARLRIVGVSGAAWVGQNADEFSGPILISPNELRTAYVGADGEPVPVVDEYEAWRRVGKKAEASQNAARIAERERAEVALPPEESLRLQGIAAEAEQGIAAANG